MGLVNLPGATEDDDVLNGSDGVDDLIDGLGGNDLIRGFAGNDCLFGRGGDDALLGGNGDDEARGGGGDDIIRGNQGEDQMFGNAGDDFMYGGGQRDGMNGGNGNDYMEGNGSADWMLGGSGGDTLIGGTGKDYLRGGTGAASEGDDDPVGDTLTGGEHADKFVFFEGEAEGDLITDFSGVNGDGDTLVFEGYSADAALIYLRFAGLVLVPEGEGTGTIVMIDPENPELPFTELTPDDIVGINPDNITIVELPI